MPPAFTRKARHELAQQLARVTLAHPQVCGNLVHIERRGGDADLAALAQRLAAAPARTTPCCPACFVEGEIRPLLCDVVIHQQWHRALERHERGRAAAPAPETGPICPVSAPPAPPSMVLDQVDRFELLRSCASKKRYPSEPDAKRIAGRCYELRGHRLRVYACTLCGGYHLTHQLRDLAQPAGRGGTIGS